MRGRKNKMGKKDGDWESEEKWGGLVQASLRKTLDEWEEEGPRAAKKIHIKVKRGPDRVTRSKGKTAEREGEERQEEEGCNEREREALVTSLRILFLLLRSSSALMFSLLRLSYPPFDFSCTAGIVLCRHLDSQSCHLNNGHSKTRAPCILRK